MKQKALCKEGFLMCRIKGEWEIGLFDPLEEATIKRTHPAVSPFVLRRKLVYLNDWNSSFIRSRIVWNDKSNGISSSFATHDTKKKAIKETNRPMIA